VVGLAAFLAREYRAASPMLPLSIFRERQFAATNAATFTTVENLFRDSKLGAALRHLPSGYPQVNTAWMWGALLAAAMAAWLHQLTAITAGEDIVHGHGVRGGKAMIATLRWRLIAVPGRLTRHARHLTLRLPPGHGLLPEVLARLRALPVPA
jgi:hypothetical protein